MAAVAVLLFAGDLAVADPQVEEARRKLKVKLTLLDHFEGDVLDLSIEVTGGDVYLRGRVRDDDLKRRVRTVARSVSGVDGVRSRIEVDSSLATPDAQAVTDAIQACRVLSALLDDMGSDAVGIEAKVDGGAVTLTFRHAMSPSVRSAALTAAKKVRGVRSVSEAGS